MKTLIKASLLAAGILAPTMAFAQVDYPVDSVRIFVPASPGGGTDAAARMFAEALQEHSDASVAIVNQPAGGGVVAAQSVATGATDGSVLFFFHAALHTANLFGQSPFSWESFTPLATVSEINEVYAVRADAPFATIEELVAYAQENPDELNIGSQLGGTTQVKGEAINQAAGGTMRIVDAGTESDRITALLGGQVDVISMSVGNAKQYVEDGQMTVLALMNENPDPAAPEFPTTISQGLNFSLPQVMTVYGPENVDPAVVEAMNAVIAELKQDEAFTETLAVQAQAPALRNADEASQFLSSEFETIAGLLGQ